MRIPVGVASLVVAASFVGGCDADEAGPTSSASTTPVASPETTTTETATVETSANERSFGLTSSFGDVSLSLEELAVDGQAVGVTLSEGGKPVRAEHDLHGAGAHVFVMGSSLRYLNHETVPYTAHLTRKWVSSNRRDTRVVVAFAGDDGSPIVLGESIYVRSESDFTFGMADPVADRFERRGLVVERDGFEFTSSKPWSGDLVYDAPAWLTLVRRDDLALTFAVGEVTDTGPGSRFSFDPVLPGPGEYLAVLEFGPDAIGYGTIPFEITVDEQGRPAS